MQMSLPGPAVVGLHFASAPVMDTIAMKHHNAKAYKNNGNKFKNLGTVSAIVLFFLYVHPALTSSNTRHAK